MTAKYCISSSLFSPLPGFWNGTCFPGGTLADPAFPGAILLPVDAAQRHAGYYAGETKADLSASGIGGGTDYLQKCPQCKDISAWAGEGHAALVKGVAPAGESLHREKALHTEGS